ncbi:unannotated protein [freshwater metagenome]|uniref:Unannotated protein n=1 Tax=freshwater metagenome TaxID=449393 RepID=A0A6J7S8H5_9ZZZZ
MAPNRRVRAIARLISASLGPPYAAEARLVAQNIGDDFVGISAANGQPNVLESSSQLSNAAWAPSLIEQSQQAVAQVCAAQIMGAQIGRSRRVGHCARRNTGGDTTALKTATLENATPDSTAPDNAAPHNTAPDNTAPHNTAPHNTAPVVVLFTLVKFISEVCPDSAPMSPGSAALRRQLCRSYFRHKPVLKHVAGPSPPSNSALAAGNGPCSPVRC